MCGQGPASGGHKQGIACPPEGGEEGFLEEGAPVAIVHWTKQGAQAERERLVSTEVEIGWGNGRRASVGCWVQGQGPGRGQVGLSCHAHARVQKPL